MYPFTAGSPILFGGCKARNMHARHQDRCMFLCCARCLVLPSVNPSLRIPGQQTLALSAWLGISAQHCYSTLSDYYLDPTSHTRLAPVCGRIPNSLAICTYPSASASLPHASSISRTTFHRMSSIRLSIHPTPSYLGTCHTPCASGVPHQRPDLPTRRRIPWPGDRTGHLAFCPLKPEMIELKLTWSFRKTVPIAFRRICCFYPELLLFCM